VLVASYSNDKLNKNTEHRITLTVETIIILIIFVKDFKESAISYSGVCKVFCWLNLMAFLIQVYHI